MPTLQQRLAEVMETEKWDQAKLREVSGQSSSVVSQWLGNVGANGKIIKSIRKPEAAKAISDASRFEALWISVGLGPKMKADSPSIPGAMAQPMSLHRAETVPSFTREQLEMSEPQKMPGVFRMPVENEEMSPRVKSGAWVQFSSTLAPEARPGDGILVRDKTGRLHFRVYKQGRPGAWEAHAANEHYEPLNSVADGLIVVAVLTAVEGRWS